MTMYILAEDIYGTSDRWTAKANTKDFLYIHIFKMQCLSYLFFQRLVAGAASSLLPGQYSNAPVCVRSAGKIHVANSVWPFWHPPSSVASLSRHSPHPHPHRHPHRHPQPIPNHLGLGASRGEKRTVTFREHGRWTVLARQNREAAE